MENEGKFKIDDYGVIPWIGKTLKCVDGFINNQLKSEGIELSRKQLIVLKTLAFEGPLPQNDLAFVTDRDKASLTRFINTLEKKNLVARIPSATDKRINLVHLTKQGEKTIQDTIPIFKNIITKMQESIPREDLNTAINVLMAIQENIKTQHNRCIDN